MVKKSDIYLFAVILYAAFIFYLSSISHPPSPSYGLMMQVYNFLKSIGLGFIAYPFYLYTLFPDKFLHFFLYLGFGLILNPAVRNYKTNEMNSVSISIIIGGVYAASDEIHQMFVPYRSATFSDFFVDLMGIIAAQMLILAFNRIIRSMKR
ncbi:hypothetical protein DRO97_08755 [Archaeoglobales archaeon]|nr:MAG: hypothetical protein DRO97_08755 [Archaeoglobales archaeon]